MTAPSLRPLADQSVVVLGASSGIGRGTALEFGRRGARVVVASRGVEALGTLVDELTGAGAQAVAVPTDITDEAAVDALVRAAEERFGRVDTRAAGALARPGELLLRARRLVRHR